MRSDGAQRIGSLPQDTTTLGTRSAAAMCDTPVSLQTSTRAPRSSAPSDHSVVAPARSTQGTPTAPSIADSSPVIARSPAVPLSTTVSPAS